MNDLLSDVSTYVDVHLPTLAFQYYVISTFTFILTIICMRAYVANKRKKGHSYYFKPDDMIKIFICSFFWPIFILYTTALFIYHQACAFNNAIILWINAGREPAPSDEKPENPKLQAFSINVTPITK